MGSAMRAWLARRLRAAATSLEPEVVVPQVAVPPAAPQADIETQRLIHKEVKERATRLDAASGRLDTKTATLLGFVSAVCIFLAGQSVSGWWKAVAYAAWAATVACGLLAMGVRVWQEAPQPEPLQRLIGPRSEIAALALLTRAQVEAFVANKKIHESKAQYWRLSLFFLVAAVLLTAAAITMGGSRNGQQPGPARSGNPSAAVR